MIKKYNQFINEKLSDYLLGPTKQEIEQTLDNYSPIMMFNQSCKIGSMYGIQKSLKKLNSKFYFGKKLTTREIINGFSSASKIDNPEALKFLLNNFEILNGYIDFSLETSFNNNCPLNVEYILKHYPNTVSKGQLITIIQNGNIDMLRIIFDNRDNLPKIVDYFSIIYAIKQGHIDIIKFLNEKGIIDVTIPNYNFIMNSVYSNNIEMVKYIVESADYLISLIYNIMNKAKWFGFENIYNYLNKVLKEKEKKLYNENVDINESLLDELKGPTEEEIWDGLNEVEPNEILVKSAEIDFLYGVKKALELGADIHYIDEEALKCAAYNGHLDVVKYLVEHGAIINTFLSSSPLVHAACNGYLDIVKYLVEHGADIHADVDYALSVAKQFNYPDIVEYIKSKM